MKISRVIAGVLSDMPFCTRREVWLVFARKCCPDSDMRARY